VKARTGRPFFRGNAAGEGLFRGRSFYLRLIFKTAWDLPVAQWG